MIQYICAPKLPTQNAVLTVCITIVILYDNIISYNTSCKSFNSSFTKPEMKSAHGIYIECIILKFLSDI